jgi:hypothetical protein
MSGPPQGPGGVRAMSVGNGPPSAGLPPHNAMPPQGGPPPAGSSGPQSQQNLNQIVGEVLFSLSSLRMSFAFHRRIGNPSQRMRLNLDFALCEGMSRPAMDFSVSTHSLLRRFGLLASNCACRACIAQPQHKPPTTGGFNFARSSPHSFGGTLYSPT